MVHGCFKLVYQVHTTQMILYYMKLQNLVNSS